MPRWNVQVFRDKKQLQARRCTCIYPCLLPPLIHHAKKRQSQSPCLGFRQMSGGGELRGSMERIRNGSTGSATRRVATRRSGQNLAEVTGDRVSGREGVSTYRGRGEPRNDSVRCEPRDNSNIPVPTCKLYRVCSTISYTLAAEGRRDIIFHQAEETFSGRTCRSRGPSMEPGGISIIPTSGIVTESSAGKSRSIGITLRTSSSIQAAKEKLKTPWLSNLMKEDATGWETLTIALGEALGTAILVFVGCTGCIGSLGSDPSVLQVSLTFGLAAMIAIQSIGHVSGAHINPSVTVAALILGKKSLPMCVLYIIAQCLGGLIGFGLLRVITPSELLYTSAPEMSASFCMTDIHENLSTFHGVMAEFLATGILVFFTCGLWDHRNARNTDSVPMRFGLCIVALCLVFIPYTGCSLNPARTLGPAVWNGYWRHHWIFWLGPFGGAIVSSLLYRCLFLCKRLDNDSGQCE